MKSKWSKLRVLLPVVMIAFMFFANQMKVKAAKEYGTNVQSAGTIVFGKEYQATIDENEGSKQHWYQFTTKATDDYYYDLVFNRLVAKDAMTVQILDTKGNFVMSVSTGSKRKQKRLKPDSVYYVNVYCSSSLSDDNYYGFTLNTVNDPETDNMAEAKIKLISGDAYNGSMAAYYEEDWLTFYAETKLTTINLAKKDNGWNLWTSIYDANGNQIKSSTVSQFAGSMTFDTEPGKLYYVKLQSNAELGEEKDMNYSILLAGSQKEKEDSQVTGKNENKENKENAENTKKTENTQKANGNNGYGTNIQSAGTIVFGKEYQATIDKNEGSKQHWYQFTTKATDDYYYDLVFNRLVAKDAMTVQILDTEGNFVMSVSTGSKRKQKRLKPDSVYYVNVYCSSSLSDDNYYGFTLNTVKDPETDSMADVEIQLSMSKTYKGSMAAYYEEDWMFFKATGSKTTIVSSKKDNGWNLWTSVYDSNGTFVTSGTTSQFTESMTFATVKGKKYYVKINGNPELGEEKDMNYSVLLKDPRVDMKKCKITVKNMKYTGFARKAPVTVKYNGRTLQKNIDYTLVYSNNRRRGKASVTITGKGDFKGKVKKTFKITR
ncbi:hypothetical protein [[Clostridium] polysaccharolyticum]|uniref:Uncharacterized protein n=1 Tax=[Clostridium] polysaccharolyticum TaxID=29364 RepID=A0A1H9Z8P7_9FIRM|nr:hypothetical protein [[Clostridium] polysaccharolyticum]SES77828.1 hypothetical protein SAMN04487772_10357 [[Clostridium] polysaccharolyticum]